MNALLASPLRLIVAGLLIGALFGTIAASWLDDRGDRFETSIAFTIDQPPRPKTSEYAYDGYYALMSSGLFADTLIAWFRTPAFVAEAYGYRADVPAEAGWAARIADGFRAKKWSSQSVTLSFRAASPETGSNDAKRLSDLAMRRASEMNRDAEGRPLFLLSAAPAVTVDKTPRPQATGLIGALVGAFLAAAFVFFRPSSARE